MGAKLQFLGGYQDGCFEVNPSTDPYVQGQPLKFNTTGQLELCLCYREGHDDGYCGLAKGWSGSHTDKLSDIYNGKATYWAGFNQMKLDTTDPRNENDDYPYETVVTYNEGDDIYINDLGQLTNIGPGGSSGYADVCDDATPIAYVIAIPTSGAQTWIVINEVR